MEGLEKQAELYDHNDDNTNDNNSNDSCNYDHYSANINDDNNSKIRTIMI